MADPVTSVPAASVRLTTPSDPTASRPDYQRPEHKDAKDTVALCRDLASGTRAIHTGSRVYLPQWSGEHPDDYHNRVRMTELFGGFQRTVQASVGMIVATPPALADSAHPLIQNDWEDIDGQGAHGEVFAKRLLDDLLTDGLCAVLVDYPPVPAGVELTLADEEALGLRPFWVRVMRGQILSWVVEIPDWKTLIAQYRAGVLTADVARLFARQAVLRQLVIHEPTDVPDNVYGTRCADRYRVLRLDATGVSFTVYEKVAVEGHGDGFQVVSAGTMEAANGKQLAAIPLAIGYANRPTAPFVVDPPLLALAELNLGHYRVSADRRYLMHVCHAPTFVIIGAEMPQAEDGTMPQREYKVGPNHTLMLPGGGDAKWVAAAPNALDSSQQEKDDLLKQMGALGMSFLAKDRQRGQSETALGRRLDDAAENATHATAARGLQDVLEQAFTFHAAYRGVEAPEVKVNTSYAAPQVDPQIALVIWNAVASDRLDVGTLVTYLQTGDLPDDIMERIDDATLVRLKSLSDAAKAAVPPGAPGVAGDAPTAPGAPGAKPGAKPMPEDQAA